MNLNLLRKKKMDELYTGVKKVPQVWESIEHYLGDNKVDASDTENWGGIPKSGSGCVLRVKKSGCLGWGSSISLLSIKTTTDMLGLSSGYGWTHNNPIWIARNTSDGLHDSTIASSSSSQNLSSL